MPVRPFPETTALVDLFADAERDLQRVLRSADATDFQVGRASRIERQVARILARLRRDITKRVRTSIVDVYRDAATAVSPDHAFDVVDVRAAEAIAFAVAREYGKAIGAVERDLRTLFVMSQQEAVPNVQLLRQVGAAGVMGLAPGDLARRIAQTLRDGATKRLRGRVSADLRQRLRAIANNQYVPIICKDGVLRRYRMRWYSEVVARTWSMTAANEARVRAADDFGADLIQISVHSGACPLCVPIQGKVYSRSGTDPDFPPMSSVDLPVHPNCRHVWTPVIAESLRERGQYEAVAAFSRSGKAVTSLAEYRQVVGVK